MTIIRAAHHIHPSRGSVLAFLSTPTRARATNMPQVVSYGMNLCSNVLLLCPSKKCTWAPEIDALHSTCTRVIGHISFYPPHPMICISFVYCKTAEQEPPPAYTKTPHQVHSHLHTTGPLSRHLALARAQESASTANPRTTAVCQPPQGPRRAAAAAGCDATGGARARVAPAQSLTNSLGALVDTPSRTGCLGVTRGHAQTTNSNAPRNKSLPIETPRSAPAPPHPNHSGNIHHARFHPHGLAHLIPKQNISRVCAQAVFVVRTYTAKPYTAFATRSAQKETPQ